jgi:hypothetical protein
MRDRNAARKPGPNWGAVIVSRRRRPIRRAIPMYRARCSGCPTPCPGFHEGADYQRFAPHARFVVFLSRPWRRVAVSVEGILAQQWPRASSKMRFLGSWITAVLFRSRILDISVSLECSKLPQAPRLRCSSVLPQFSSSRGEQGEKSSIAVPRGTLVSPGVADGIRSSRSADPNVPGNGYDSEHPKLSRTVAKTGDDRNVSFESSPKFFVQPVEYGLLH